MEANIETFRRVRELHEKRRKRRRPVFTRVELVPLDQVVKPQVIQTAPVQPSQGQTGDDIGSLIALAWQVGLKAWEPKWEKVSPGSLLVYKLSEKLAASPSITPEGRQWMYLIQAWAFIYGLDKSDS